MKRPLLAKSAITSDHTRQMQTGPQSHPTPADVLTTSAILEGDEKANRSSVAERDRRIGLELGAGGDRIRTALRWMKQVCRENSSMDRLHEQISAATNWCSVILALLGGLLGIGAALGVFFFDGSGRVNSIGVIAVLVLLPALFLIPFAVAALPAGIVARIPVCSALAALSRGVNPGRLAPIILRFFPAETRDAWSDTIGRAARNQVIYGSLRKWTALGWSQIFAVGFQAGALIAALSLILFTDLAFGWSTTLTSGDPLSDAETVHRMTSTLAAPWSWALESADPAKELILESRYFRAAEASLNPAEAARLGAWWPFIIMTMFVYGLLPRLATVALTHSRVKAAARLTLYSLPGLSPVLRRLKQAHLQTTSDEPEAKGDRDGLPSANGPDPMEAGPIGATINWSGVPAGDEAIQRVFGAIPIHPAGGSATVESDRNLVEAIAGELGSDAGVALIVKAWEPPLMELVDFLKLLRGALQKRTPILVVPVGFGTGSALADGSPEQLAIWKSRINGMGDPWLQVGPLAEVAPS